MEELERKERIAELRNQTKKTGIYTQQKVQELFDCQFFSSIKIEKESVTYAIREEYEYSDGEFLNSLLSAIDIFALIFLEKTGIIVNM